MTKYVTNYYYCRRCSTSKQKIISMIKTTNHSEGTEDMQIKLKCLTCNKTWILFHNLEVFNEYVRPRLKERVFFKFK